MKTNDKHLFIISFMLVIFINNSFFPNGSFLCVYLNFNIYYFISLLFLLLVSHVILVFLLKYFNESLRIYSYVYIYFFIVYFWSKLARFVIVTNSLIFFCNYFNFIFLLFIFVLIISPMVYYLYPETFSFIIKGRLFSVSILWAFLFSFIFVFAFILLFIFLFFIFNKSKFFFFGMTGYFFLNSMYLSFFLVLCLVLVLGRLKFSYYVFVWGRVYKAKFFRGIANDCLVMIRIIFFFLCFCEYGLCEINDEFFNLKFDDKRKFVSLFNLLLFSSSYVCKLKFFVTVFYYYTVLGYILIIFWLIFYLYVYFFSTNGDLMFIEREDGELFIYLYTLASLVTGIYLSVPLISVLGSWDCVFGFI